MMLPLRPGGRILIVKLSSLGDLFHVLPAVRSLKQGLDLTVDWLTQPEYLDLVKCFTDVSSVYVFPRQHVLRGWRSFQRQFTDSYDAVIDLQGLCKSALAARGAAHGAPVLGHREHREGAGLLYTTCAGHRQPHRHAVERWLELTEAAGGAAVRGFEEGMVQFPVPNMDAGECPVGLVPRSRWPGKNWPPERFRDMAESLREQRPDARFFCFGGPEDTESCEWLAREIKGAESLAGRLSLLESGGALSRMRAVCSVDSGPMHMAVAAGVPVVGLFGVTDPVRTGPYGPRHRVLQPDYPLGQRPSPRAFKTAEEGSWDLDPQLVAEAMLRLLGI